MSWTNDPVADAERHAAEGENNIIKCEECERAIYDTVYEINGAELCASCVDKIFGKDVSEL